MEPSPLRVALAEAGIGEPTISRLAASPHLTPAMVRQVTERAHVGGKGNGVIVNDLRARHEAMLAQAATKSKRQTAQTQEAERQQETHEQNERNRTERQAWYDSLTPDALSAREQAILSGMTAAQRRFAQPGSRVLRELVMSSSRQIGGAA